MTDEIKLWAIDGSGEASEVEPTNRTDTEDLLEGSLVANPKILLPGLTIVGRQTPTTGGPLDLLGVDSSGQLIVFELKRGTVTRDAVTQAIDYASSLESMTEVELAVHIAERSGTNGIDKIDDFEEWYSQRFAEQQLTSLKPVQMMLVGLGTDEKAIRMVDFLAKRGVGISLLTFYGHRYEGKTILARRVQAESLSMEEVKVSSSRRERIEARRKAAAEQAKEFGIDGLLNDVLDSFKQIGSYHNIYPNKTGYTFYRRSLDLMDDGKFNGSYSVGFTTDKKIRITFYPIAIHLCEAQFSAAERVVAFKHEPPPNAPMTNGVTEQWYCLLDEKEWGQQKDTITELAAAVYKAWSEALQNSG